MSYGLKHNVVHIAVHHDPEGRCKKILQRNANKLSTILPQGVVIVSKETIQDDSVRILLESSGLKVVLRPPQFFDLDRAANFALRDIGLSLSADTYFFGCLDRTLHWVDRYPEELKQIVSGGTQGYDFLVVGRTRRAFNTHPIEQKDPEHYINDQIGKLLGMTSLDVTAACRILNKNAADCISTHISKNFKFPKEGTVITDYLWPYVIFRNNLTVGQTLVEGMEFETPDQFEAEISEMGYENWLKKYFTEAHKRKRWEQAYAVDTIQTYVS